MTADPPGGCAISYHTPAMGDIRHVLCAMAEVEDDHLFADLMNFRFSGSSDIGGHQLGNLIFLALMDITGSFMGAVQAISKSPESTRQHFALYPRQRDSLRL